MTSAPEDSDSDIEIIEPPVRREGPPLVLRLSLNRNIKKEENEELTGEGLNGDNPTHPASSAGVGDEATTQPPSQNVITEPVQGNIRQGNLPLNSQNVESAGQETQNENHTQDEAENVNDDDDNRDRFPCAYCDLVFNTYSSRCGHYSTEHRLQRENSVGTPRTSSQGGLSFTCSFAGCSKSFPTNFAKQNHEKMAHIGSSSNAQGPVASSSAAETAETPPEPAVHNESTSFIEEPSNSSTLSQRCKKCNKFFLNDDFFKRHQLDHSTPPSGDIYCEKCGQVFRAKQYLSRHRNTTKCGNPPVDLNTSGLREREDPPELASNEISRKRVHNDSATTNDNRESTENVQNNFTPPSVKKPIIMKKAVQRPKPTSSVATAVGSPDRVLDADASFAVKTESTQVQPQTPISSPLIRFPTYEYARREAATRPAENNVSNMNCQTPDVVVEKSPLPLPAGICDRAKENPEELLLIWSDSLNEDLQAAAKLNPDNCFLCIQELDGLMLPEEQREQLEDSHFVRFGIVVNGVRTTWTVISFGELRCPAGLNLKLFSDFSQVEIVFSGYAEAKEKTLVNVMRFSRNGLFGRLSQKLAKKTICFNWKQQN